jgi:hypothetical protein
MSSEEFALCVKRRYGFTYLKREYPDSVTYPEPKPLYKGD